MRALVLALLVVACDGGCNATVIGGTPTPPTSTGTPPPPVVADAGDACMAACNATVALCPQTKMTPGICAAQCAEAMRQLSGPSANPRCLAAELRCSSKEWCTP